MDDNIAIWTITWTITWKIKQRGRWSEEILFIFPENFTHPNSLAVLLLLTQLAVQVFAGGWEKMGRKKRRPGLHMTGIQSILYDM